MSSAFPFPGHQPIQPFGSVSGSALSGAIITIRSITTSEMSGPAIADALRSLMRGTANWPVGPACDAMAGDAMDKAKRGWGGRPGFVQVITKCVLWFMVSFCLMDWLVIG